MTAGSDMFAQLRMAMLPVGESVWRPWGASRTKRNTQSTTHAAEHIHTAHKAQDTHTADHTHTEHTAPHTHTAEHIHTAHSTQCAASSVRSFAASFLSSALQLTHGFSFYASRRRLSVQEDGKARSCGRGRYRSCGHAHNAQALHGSAPTERPSYGPYKEGE